MLSNSEIKKIALSIEEELYNLFQETGTKYKAKYRSLIFNIKDLKNKVCLRGCFVLAAQIWTVRLGSMNWVRQKFVKLHVNGITCIWPHDQDYILYRKSYRKNDSYWYSFVALISRSMVWDIHGCKKSLDHKDTEGVSSNLVFGRQFCPLYPHCTATMVVTTCLPAMYFTEGDVPLLPFVFPKNDLKTVIFFLRFQKLYYIILLNYITTTSASHILKDSGWTMESRAIIQTVLWFGIFNDTNLLFLDSFYNSYMYMHKFHWKMCLSGWKCWFGSTFLNSCLYIYNCNFNVLILYRGVGVSTSCGHGWVPLG